MLSKLRKYASRVGDAAERRMRVRVAKAKIRTIHEHLDRASVRAVEGDKDFLDASRAFLERYFPQDTDLSWHVAYAAMTGIRRPEYIPELMFYHMVEPVLNPRVAAVGFDDKNTYDTLFQGVPMARTLGRIVYGRPRSADYRHQSTARLLDDLQRAGCGLVMRPSVGTAGGSGVRVLSREEVAAWTEAAFRRETAGVENMVFSALLGQHPALSALHSASLNTIRIMTLRLGGPATVLSAVLRMGIGGMRVDNYTAGGICCGVQPSGALTAAGIDRRYLRYESHPTTGVRFEGVTVPSYGAACEMCINLHERLPMLGLVSWDVSVAEDGSPVLIEANVNQQDINIHQGNNGPLFGAHTSELLNMLADAPRVA
jgi:hypothetical protein